MGLFSAADRSRIDAVAKASNETLNNPKKSVVASPSKAESELQRISAEVESYFSGSPAIVITELSELSNYVDKCIEFGYAGIDTETTGLDRVRDTIVGASLYVPGQPECYIPMKHIGLYTDSPIKGQLSYQDVGHEFQRLVDNGVKLIFANADFDLSMINKDLGVDMCDAFYYDVILAWRCMKEDEKDNSLKGLYNKYVLKGEGDPKKFRDFFTPKLFPYSKPAVAGLYAANDAKITYDLFKWQLPYILKDNPKCKAKNLEAIADLVWNVEFPLVKVCQMMHRTGVYIDKDVASALTLKYNTRMDVERSKLADMVDDIVEKAGFRSDMPFTSGQTFNSNSTKHVSYLLYKLMNIPQTKYGSSTDKSVLKELNLPITNQILNVRSLSVLINTFVDKLPRSTTPDSRIHAQFRQIGADTGRFCIAKGTKITVLNGEKHIEDIVPGDLVYCYDDSGTLQLSSVKNLWLTGQNKDCVRVKWQSSGSGDIGELICTPEHRILRKTGEWVRADELKRYDKVVHLRRTVSNSRERRPDLYGWNNLAIKEQDVVKYSVFGCTDSSNYVIHHKDENPNNNAIDNLELMTVQDHTRYHSKKMHEEGRLRYSHLQDEHIKAIRVQRQREAYVARTLSEKDKLLQMIQDCNGRLSQVDADFDNFKHRCEVAGIDVEAECRKYNPRYHKSRIPEDEFKTVYEQYRGLAVRITEHFKISYDKFYKYCEEYNISRNHMIVSVEPAGKYDVYDIEVETYHNFIANEICVHNSSSEPNVQNIPSRSDDIRHMFRATPGYVMLSSDYSQQEPKITAFVSQDSNMISAFQAGKDIYATIAGLAFNLPYEKCLEFHPETHEYQPDGKARRNEAKTIVLGIVYGRSVVTIADQLFGSDTSMSDEAKVKSAQKVYDAVLAAFPNLRSLMLNSQKMAKQKGYVETILGRRRHIPDMQLEPFEFVPMASYVNPDVDPMDINTLQDQNKIPDRVISRLRSEFEGYKYFGQIVKRTNELQEEGIRVINNKSKIADASRKCTNSIVQGSAADMTKLAILMLETDPRWKSLGGRLLLPVHDELICEVPIDKWEEGGRLLAEIMSKAGDFLPFPITCDVETSIRWYGLSYPCPYTRPNSLSNMTDDETRWVQYMVHELEYQLPVYKDENGEKPRGDAAKGVNGIMSPELSAAISDFKSKYQITSDEEFIEKIETKVIKGE